MPHPRREVPCPSRPTPPPSPPPRSSTTSSPDKPPRRPRDAHRLGGRECGVLGQPAPGGGPLAAGFRGDGTPREDRPADDVRAPACRSRPMCSSASARPSKAPGSTSGPGPRPDGDPPDLGRRARAAGLLPGRRGGGARTAGAQVSAREGPEVRQPGRPPGRPAPGGGRGRRRHAGPAGACSAPCWAPTPSCLDRGRDAADPARGLHAAARARRLAARGAQRDGRPGATRSPSPPPTRWRPPFSALAHLLDRPGPQR